MLHRGSRAPPPDRKSTRLNSSHTVISYAVFCLKKKKKKNEIKNTKTNRKKTNKTNKRSKIKVCSFVNFRLKMKMYLEDLTRKDMGIYSIVVGKRKTWFMCMKCCELIRCTLDEFIQLWRCKSLQFADMKFNHSHRKVKCCSNKMLQKSCIKFDGT